MLASVGVGRPAAVLAEAVRSDCHGPVDCVQRKGESKKPEARNAKFEALGASAGIRSGLAPRSAAGAEGAALVGVVRRWLRCGRGCCRRWRC